MLGRSKINQCTLMLTHNCNLRCEFCFAKKTEYIKNEFIDYEYLKKIIDFCCEAKIKYIVLTGGEPTLYPNLSDVIKYIKSRKHKMLATITTNGTKFDDMTYCQKLIRCGLDYVDVSLKGEDREAFLSVTGCDCFQNQLQAIKNLAALSVDFTCSMVITHGNVGSLCGGLKSAYDSGARQFSFTFVIDNQASDIKDEQYLEKNNPFTLVESFISQIDEINSITKGEWWIEYSFPMCIYTEKQLSLLKGRLAAPCQIHKRNGVTFDSKMNFLPCVMNIGTIMGQYGSDFSTYKEFKKLLKRNSYQITIDSLNKLPSECCKSCSYLKDCQGGCTFFWTHCSFDAFTKFKERFFED